MRIYDRFCRNFIFFWLFVEIEKELLLIKYFSYGTIWNWNSMYVFWILKAVANIWALLSSMKLLSKCFVAWHPSTCLSVRTSGLNIRWSSLQTKEGQMRIQFRLVGLENSQMPSTSKVWPSDHRDNDMFCAWPFYSLIQIFPKSL